MSDVTAQDAAFRNGDRSKILSHSVRLLEPASSSPILTRSLASNRLSPSNAFFCGSIIHSSKYFSRPSVLPLEYPVITLRLSSSSNSSWFLGLKLGILLKNSHASFFLAWKRCFSSTRVFQNSRLRSNSAGLLFTSCCLIEASSLSVASTKSLSVSSARIDLGDRLRGSFAHGLALGGTATSGPWVQHHRGMGV